MIDYSCPWALGIAGLIIGLILGAWANPETSPVPNIDEPKSDLWLGDLVARMADEANLPVSTMAQACKTLRRHPGALRRLLDFPVHTPPPPPLPGEKRP